MALTIQASTETFELPPAGATAARCCAVIDLGTQESTYQGEVKHSPKVLLTFELAETRSDGTAHRVSRRMTTSLHPKAQLRAFLEQWRGRAFTEDELAAFNVAKLAGAPCLLNLAHVERNGKQYANILSVSPVPKGMTAPGLQNAPTVFDMSAPDWQAFAGLSSRMQETISTSPEYKVLKKPAAVGMPPASEQDANTRPPSDFGDFEDDVSF